MTKDKLKFWIIYYLSPLLVVFLVLVILPASYNIAQNNKIYHGVSIGSVNVGGLASQQAQNLLQKKWYQTQNQGWELVDNMGQRVLLPTLVTSAGDPDLTYNLIGLDLEQTIAQAVNFFQMGNIFQKFWGPLWIKFTGQSIKPVFKVEQERILVFVRENFSSLEQSPQPAKLIVDVADNLSVVAEKSGTVLDEEKFWQDLQNRLDNFSNQSIFLSVKKVTPELTEEKVAGLLLQAKTWLKDLTLTLKYQDNKWQVEPLIWHHWLGVKMQDNIAQVGLLVDLAQDYFAKEISNNINQSPQDAKFKLENGKVKEFINSQQGRELELVASVDKIEQAIRDNQTSIELVVKIIEPKIVTAATNELGIAEIIGIGRSNFAGSPKNRRFNIKVGASTLNGVLIQPEEEFSLIKNLGKIDETTGYLQELVIKGNKTIPEFGGGLCQIGTTTFRAALASGLPIVERRNHSYRVPYYEPAGTDATIYDPKPDLRFTNDTGRAILIQAKIEGDNLIFEFWGTKDGRQVEQTKPKISNIISPPPAKIVETEDLPVGEKKCTEKAHAGADTEFTYTVTYADGTKKEKVFKSHYVAWQEVCLVGVPKGTLQNQPAGEGAVLSSSDTTRQQ